MAILRSGWASDSDDSDAPLKWIFINGHPAYTDIDEIAEGSWLQLNDRDSVYMAGFLQEWFPWTGPVDVSLSVDPQPPAPGRSYILHFSPRGRVGKEGPLTAEGAVALSFNIREWMPANPVTKW